MTSSTPRSSQAPESAPDDGTDGNDGDDHNGFVSPQEPLSPFSEPEVPVIPTDDLGMIADDELSPEKSLPQASAVKKRRPVRTRRKITYVSKHFVKEAPGDEGQEEGGKAEEKATTDNTEILKPLKPQPEHLQDFEACAAATPPATPARPRIYYGVNIDELSSDSSLTDVPDDIGPDPFLPVSPPYTTPSKVRAVKTKISAKSRVPTKSPYFPSPHKHRPTFLSTLPFPPLSHDTFGLMQERLAHDPFRLLIATIFLNKTPGERAMPIFYQLMSRYPTPTDLASAEVGDVTSIIYELGFQNQRARKCVAMAKVWIEKPPERGKRYRKHNYPLKGDGRDVGKDEVLSDNDERVAWEISHLPGLGPYSHDSWRMFCRDELRQLARSWNGEGAEKADEFEPEWKRVVPLDKELRAWLTWMWLKEEWVWNKETGKRTKAGTELMSMAQGGGIVVEEQGSEHLTVQTVSQGGMDNLERAAGEFLPE